jgi:hypothetical protein
MIKINECYDNSQLSTFQMCPMAYYLQYIVGIKKGIIDDSNAAMNFGSYFHKYAESLYGKTGVKFNEIIHDYEEPGGLPQYSKEGLELFCKTFYQKYNEQDKIFTIKETEKTSIFDLGAYKFIVKKDGAFEHQGNTFGLEHKTTKSISYNYFDKFFLSSQISAQVYDVQRIYGSCSGIMINGGEIKALQRKPSVKSEDKYDGIIDIDVWVKDKHYVCVCCRFNRDFINRNPSEILDWKENTLYWIDRIEECKREHLWFKSTGIWGGGICAKCQYKELCKTSVGLELDESILDVLYEKTDPYQYLKEEVADVAAEVS